jgi:hypothetical protein
MQIVRRRFVYVDHSGDGGGSAVPYAGTATITGVINMYQRMQNRLL